MSPTPLSMLWFMYNLLPLSAAIFNTERREGENRDPISDFMDFLEI